MKDSPGLPPADRPHPDAQNEAPPRIAIDGQPLTAVSRGALIAEVIRLTVKVERLEREAAERSAKLEEVARRAAESGEEAPWTPGAFFSDENNGDP